VFYFGREIVLQLRNLGNGRLKLFCKTCMSVRFNKSMIKNALLLYHCSTVFLWGSKRSFVYV